MCLVIRCKVCHLKIETLRGTAKKKRNYILPQYFFYAFLVLDFCFVRLQCSPVQQCPFVGQVFAHIIFRATKCGGATEE